MLGAVNSFRDDKQNHKKISFFNLMPPTLHKLLKQLTMTSASDIFMLYFQAAALLNRENV